jgi:hypothetical protein
MLHSRVHEIWSIRMASWHGVGNDPTYNSTTCFETFPFPRPTDEQCEAIGAAAQELDEKRRAWLAQLHARLDRAVWSAYGWDDPEPAAVEEDVILSRLLALNLDRAGTEEG